MKIAPPNPIQLVTQPKWKVSPPDSNPNHIGRRQKGGNNTDLERGGIVKVLWVILLYIREHIIYVSCFSALIQHLCYLKASVFCGSGSGSLDPGTHRHELFKGLFVKRQPLVQSLSQLKIILIEDIIIVAFNHTKPGKQIFLECLFSKLELVAKNFLDLNFGF